MRRILTLLLACALLTILFAGCTGGNDEVSGDDLPGTGNENEKDSRGPFFITARGNRIYETETVVNEVITPGDREAPASRQRTSELLAFGIDGLEEDEGSFGWDFGDGTSDTGFFADHAYALPGIFTLSLTVDFGDGTSEKKSAVIYVNYHAEGKDTVSGIGCPGYDKINDDDYWEYLFPIGENAWNATVKTWADPSDSPAIPPTPPATGGDNDIALEACSPSGEVLGSSDGEKNKEKPSDEEVRLKQGKLGEPGDYIARIGCFDAGPLGHSYTNTGDVAYFFSITVNYYHKEE
ncbi:MAG: hypothetical protein CVT48_02870 [Thermoplasmata archaeon HGW-Thermoplasmata-1]|nr:MAG: hypothetical protein CVT48_02870 [Thermoplasmata archaeon HGW-Thermoplasmata-1]